jgi:AbrB family looped-hinge helix DNA binding protein
MKTEHVRMGDDGRIVIPAATRKDVGFQPGDTLVVESDGDSLLIRNLDTVVREVQSYFQQFVEPGSSIVDQFLADRAHDFTLEESKFDDRSAPHV